MEKLTDLSLPAFAFLDDYESHGKLEGRNVVVHVRSMSVIEIFAVEHLLYLEPHVITHNFDYVDPLGVVEHFKAALHVCATLDTETDRDMIIKEVMIPACDWYRDYLEWEDKNVMEEGLGYE